MELECGNLILRPITLEDTDNILTWRNKPSVKKFFIHQKDISRKEHINWMKTKVDTGDVIQFIIIEKQNAHPIGSVYLQNIDLLNKKAEFGIFIGEDHLTNRGFGAAAAECMIKYAFDKMELHKLYLRVYEDNSRAISSYLKAGFKKEAVLKDDVYIDGKYRNIVLMGVLNSK